MNDQDITVREIVVSGCGQKRGTFYSIDPQTLGQYKRSIDDIKDCTVLVNDEHVPDSYLLKQGDTLTILKE